MGELFEVADVGGEEEEVGDLGGEFEESWSTRTTRLSVPPRPPFTWMAGGEVAWGGEVLAWCWSSDLDLCRGFLEDVEAERQVWLQFYSVYLSQSRTREEKCVL